MSASNIYAANPIEEDNPKHQNASGQDSFAVQPMIQKNSQEDVRTLLNPVAVDPIKGVDGEDDDGEVNEFSKFEEEEVEGGGDGRQHQEEQDLLVFDDLQKDKVPVKINSSSSLNTLENNQEQPVATDPLIQLDDEKEKVAVAEGNGQEGAEDPNVEDKEENSSSDKENSDSIMNDIDADIKMNKPRVIRKSLTDADMNTLNRKISFNSSSNIRNIDGRDVVVDRKYRNINCIQENSTGEDGQGKKDFQSFNALLGNPTLNTSMELFLNKQKKNNKFGSSKFEIENTNFM